MVNVFDYIKSEEKYKDISPLCQSAIQYYLSDPQSAVMKTALVLETILDDIISRESLTVKFNDLKGKIFAVTNLTPPQIVSEMTQIRLLRNDGGAHYSTASTDKFSVLAESFFALNKIYEILVWYVNFGRNKRIEFASFSTFAENLNPMVKREEVVSMEKVELPNFFFDPQVEAQVVKQKANPLLLEKGVIIKVFKEFFTSNKSLIEIEKDIFGISLNEGEKIYQIITLYKKIGITKSWRDLVIMNGKEKTIILLNKHIEILPAEKRPKYIQMRDLLLEVFSD